jgi:hypothetical protein
LNDEGSWLPAKNLGPEISWGAHWKVSHMSANGPTLATKEPD